MKTLILSTITFLTISVNALASNTYPNNEKVLKTFTEVFKSANDVVWSTTGNYYDAYFKSGSIKTRARLDNRGNLIQTIRYYKEENLPANVLYSLKKSYPGKEVFGITEVSNKNGINYRIVLKDDKNYIHINANSDGDTEMVSKYKRGDK